MARPLTITESGVLYDMQHSMKKLARPMYSGRRHPKATAPSFKGPRLFRVLRWLERFSPPKVLLIFAPDTQLGKPITVSETRNVAND
jgi:hypothetical protein